MGRTNRESTKNLSVTHPVLTGESRSDWALWQLSSILAEIAGQSVRSENNYSESIEKRIQQKINNGKVFPLTEDAGDA